MFKNREEAAQKLAEALKQQGSRADIVLAIPRGGVPMGRILADALKLPLDIIEAEKLGAPGNPELAVGAVAAGGSVWLNEEIIRHLNVGRDYIDRVRKEGALEAEEKVRRLRGAVPGPDLRGRKVIVVDDGIATGATLRACLQQIRSEGASFILLAVPVAPPDTLEQLKTLVDETICLDTPAHFQAVGQFYLEFPQVPDEEVRKLLGSGIESVH